MDRKADFEIRALELHSLYALDYAWIHKCLDYMTALGLNALILHRNDIVEATVYPGALFGYEGKEGDNSVFDVYSQCFRKIFKNTPTRRSGIFNRRAFLKKVLLEAKRRGISVYIENKEIYFPDILTEFYPHLLHDGHVCPTDPFWDDFLRIKFTEFFRDYPEVVGVITSVATSESKISIKSNRCTCERCRNTTSENWYRRILGVMHDVLSSLGKEFIVRDFVFDSKSQKEIATVMEEMPSDVIISLKNTPHDYYPTFPINGRIGDVGNHRQWIEFDTMGQYFGFGVGVADLCEDYRRRLKDAKAKGVYGVIWRTDWESLDGHSTFATPNLINLYSGAALSVNTDAEPDDIYGLFAEREGLIAGDKEGAVKWIRSVLGRTWAVTSKTVFVDGCVFSDSSTMPISMEHALWLAEEKNSLKDWDHSKEHSLSPLKASVEKAFEEKEEALRLIDEIIRTSDVVPACVQAEKGAWLKQWMHFNRLYVELFRLCTRLVMLARYILQTKETDANYLEQKKNQFKEEISNSHKLEAKLRALWKDTDCLPHVIYTLLDPDRVDCLRRNMECLFK